MATTHPPSGYGRVALLTSLFAAIQAGILIEVVLLTRSTEPAAKPAGRSDAVAWWSEDGNPAPASVISAAEYAADDKEAPPEPPAVVDVAAALPAPPTATTPASVAETADDLPTPAPADRPVPDLPAPRWTPEQLQASLLHVPEVWLQHPAVPIVLKTGRATGTTHPLLAVLDARPDLRGLPARRAPDAQLPPAEAEAFRDVSVLLRKGLSELAGDKSQNRRLVIRPEVLKAQPQVVARVMHQMFQVEAVQLWKLLLTHLKQIRDPAASRVLAHRAVYEPVTELRQAAVQALTRRPAVDYLTPLLDAFDSPWPPAADFAADALATLALTEAVPELVRRLDGPDPSAPPSVVRDLVRVNHARNCLLCHAQSVSSRDGIRVAVPSPIRPLPPPFSLATYEGGGRSGSRTSRDTVFARPDITYLQQDFSWVLPVASPGTWPALQRFDFVVRTRPSGPGDAAAGGVASPQKLAVLRTLRALTGKDFGDRPSAWRAGLAVAKKGE